MNQGRTPSELDESLTAALICFGAFLLLGVIAAVVSIVGYI
jgi:hypothetical protein